MLIKSLCKGSSSITKMEVSMLVTNLIFAQSPDGQKEDVDDSKNGRLFYLLNSHDSFHYFKV